MSDGVLLTPSDINAGMGIGKFFPLETAEDFKPPFVLKATVMTDSNEIRFHWNKMQVFIFSWEHRRNELRFRDPSTGEGMGLQGKGFVAPNKWHNFVWEVNPDGMKISVDGQVAFDGKGDYKSVSGRVGIFTYGGAKVSVKSFLIENRK